MGARADDDAHDLDYDMIDSRDEISGDEQQVLIWCNTHEDWEWHWVRRDWLGD